MRIFQPKDFGLTQWNPLEMDILTHLDSMAKCVAEARSMGATESNLIRLLMRTMPDNYKFLSEFVAPYMRNTYENFAMEVARILSERAPTQMATFLQATRKPEEHLLAYFYRISSLYKSSNGLIGNEWQHNPTHVTAILAKVSEALDENGKNELTRRLEKFETEDITTDRLKTELVEVSKLNMCTRKRILKQESLMALNGVESLEYDQNPYSLDKTDSRENERPGCWQRNQHKVDFRNQDGAGQRTIQYIEEAKAMSDDYAD